MRGPEGDAPAGPPDPPEDAALRIGRYHREGFGRGYGLEVIHERAGEVGYRWTKCDILETYRRERLDGLAICEGHEAWWREIGGSVDPALDVRITQNMRDGAPWCEIWFRARTKDAAGG